MNVIDSLTLTVPVHLYASPDFYNPIVFLVLYEATWSNQAGLSV
jgi:hypothetical protein